MAFFKSRSNSLATEESLSDDAQSMDSLRQQARHRLIGATVLVVIAVIGFALVFDTKPRDVAADIRIDMPEREAARASRLTAIPVPDKQALESPPASQAVATGADKTVSENTVVPEPLPPALIESKPLTPKAQDSKSADTKGADNNKSKPVPSENLATESKNSDKAETTAPRFVVQIGAYSDEAKVKEVRTKLEKAGYTTYIHVAKTKEGKRTRVRLGPFATKEEAQKMVSKVKSLNFNAALLTL